MKIKFDPNQKGNKPPAPRFATYIPDRRPEWKIHSALGHAKNAFQYRSNAILYEYIDEEWVERARIEDKPRSYNNQSPCSNCGLDRNSLPGIHVRWRWKEFDYKPFCGPCSKLKT